MRRLAMVDVTGAVAVMVSRKLRPSVFLEAGTNLTTKFQKLGYSLFFFFLDCFLVGQKGSTAATTNSINSSAPENHKYTMSPTRYEFTQVVSKTTGDLDINFSN